MSETPRPELVVAGFPAKPRPRWTQLATSADHKDLGRILIGGALGFLFLAALQMLLMRLQLAIPDNSFLSPVAFNRMLSTYGATAIFFFAIPLVIGFFYYAAPLQVGARGTALPRLGQLGAALFAAGVAARTKGKVLWCVTRQDLFAPALAQAGLLPGRVVYVEAGEVEVVNPFTGKRHLEHGLGPTQFMAEIAFLNGIGWNILNMLLIGLLVLRIRKPPVGRPSQVGVT